MILSQNPIQKRVWSIAALAGVLPPTERWPFQHIKKVSSRKNITIGTQNEQTSDSANLSAPPTSSLQGLSCSTNKGADTVQPQPNLQISDQTKAVRPLVAPHPYNQHISALKYAK